MRHAATVRDVGAPKEEPKFLVRLAATATSGTRAIDGDSSGSRRTSVPDAQILGASIASRQDGGRKQPEAQSCCIARIAYRFVDVLSAGELRFDPEPPGRSFSWPCRNLREPGAAPRLLSRSTRAPASRLATKKSILNLKAPYTAPYPPYGRPGASP